MLKRSSRYMFAAAVGLYALQCCYAHGQRRSPAQAPKAIRAGGLRAIERRFNAGSLGQTGNKSGIGTTVGDITIAHYKTFKLNTRNGANSGYTFIGPGIVIQSLDKTRPTQFRFVADEVIGRRIIQGQKVFGAADLRGNIHYSITQQTEQGRRMVEGTAGHATYDQQAAQIHLTDGVHATFMDTASLNEPGTLRAGSLVVPTDKSGQFDLAGSPDVNDIALTLKPAAIKSGANSSGSASGFAGPVHLYHFRSGLLELGRLARVSGAGASLDFTDTTDQTQGRIASDTITADFDNGFHRASAEGDVQYRLERPGQNDTEQSIMGTCGAATYDADAYRAELTGNVTARIVDPETLEGPAHLAASRVVQQRLNPPASNANASSAPAAYRYRISGSPDHTRVQFTPKPAKQTAARTTIPASASAAAPSDQAAGAQPKPTPFAIGAVEVTGFADGSFEPGKSGEFTGDTVAIQTADPAAHTSSQLSGSRITAAFADDRTLASMQATGNVRFGIQQPYTGQTGTKGVQKIEGNAAQATFTNGSQNQVIALSKPHTVRLSSPDDPEPAVLTGGTDDNLTYNLTTGDLVDESPDKGSTFRFIPRESATKSKTQTQTKPKTNKPKHS